MIQRREGLCFTLEACKTVGIGAKGVPQNFDCNVAIQLRVSRSIDLSHSSFAKQRRQFIRTKSSSNHMELIIHFLERSGFKAITVVRLYGKRGPLLRA